MGKPSIKPDNNTVVETAALTVPAPSIASALQSPAALQDTGSGKLSHGTLNHMLKTAGAKVDHVGGTLPPIGFANVGDAYLLQFLARDEATEDREFTMLVFEVLDPKKWIETRDTETSKLYRGTITESWAFKEYCSKAAGNLGKVIKVTYLGTQKVKTAAHNDVKLFAIEEPSFGGDTRKKT